MGTMKALMIRPGALGDTLMLMPALAQLRSSTDITLVGRLPGIDLLEPYVGRALHYEGPGWHTLFLDNPGELPPLPLPGVDLAAAFLTDHEGRVRTNLRALLPGIPVHVFSPFPPQDQETHVALYIARCLARAGLAVNPERALEVAALRPLFDKAEGFLRTGGLILHPGSGSEKKNYPADFWLDLLGRMRKDIFHDNEKFILLLGPAEEPLLSFYQNNIADRETDVVFSPRKEDLIVLLREAFLYIGHDSGITHLAAMLGTPVVALYRNSSVEQWRPLGPSIKIIADEKAGPALLDRVVQQGGALIRDRQGCRLHGGARCHGNGTIIPTRAGKT